MDQPNEGSEESEAASGPPFLLNPENAEFLAGHRPLPDTSLGQVPPWTDSLTVGAMIAFGFLAFALLAISSIRHGEFLTAELAGAAMVVFLFVVTWLIRRHFRIQELAKREGKVLEGRVLTTGFKRAQNSDSGQSYFIIWVQYVFRSPSGQALSSTNERVRNDFEHGKLPCRGARVLVFYVSDRNFYML